MVLSESEKTMRKTRTIFSPFFEARDFCKSERMRPFRETVKETVKETVREKLKETVQIGIEGK